MKEEVKSNLIQKFKVYGIFLKDTSQKYGILHWILLWNQYGNLIEHFLHQGTKEMTKMNEVTRNTIPHNFT